jgi:hypothetical protein
LFNASGGSGDDNIFVFFRTGGTFRGSISNAVFRDPSAWYHLVVAIDTTQATDTNRVKIYINGVQQTTNNSYGLGYVPQNTDTGVNTTTQHRIGDTAVYTPSFLDAYLTEVNFIDGQALTPSSFGETSTTTGVWQPKKYAGTYGTNGFYLPFTDNSALTTSSNVGLGKDFSGNGNYWATNNISITSGQTYDSMTDVPTLTSAIEANYCVLNPLDKNLNNITISNGNLRMSTTDTNFGVRGSMFVSSGKWYWEITVTALGTSSTIGIANFLWTLNYVGSSSGSYSYESSTGNKYNAAASAAYGATWTTGDVIGIALNMDAGTLTFYKNNTSQGVAYSSLSGSFAPAISGAVGTVEDANFGQRPFLYTPPGNHIALNTFNLPTPTIGATASTQANKYFDATIYTGNGSTQSIVNSGSMSPDFVWIKGRSDTWGHALTDVVRGVTKRLTTNTTAAEVTTSTGVTSLNSNGFSLSTNGDVNNASDTYVAWQWDAGGTGVSNTAGTITSTVSANTTAGFSVVTYTGNGTSGATIGHGLGVAPKFIIVKRRDSAEPWPVQGGVFGPPEVVIYFLNTTASYNYPAPQYWNDTAPTSSVFSVGNDSTVNASGGTYVAYLWNEIAGYSKTNFYDGNGSDEGIFVYTGFRPRFVMVKSINEAGNSWFMFDSARSPSNVVNKYLLANSSGVDNTADVLDFVSNGFKMRNTFSGLNGSGTRYMYLAFAETPFNYSNAR